MGLYPSPRKKTAGDDVVDATNFKLQRADDWELGLIKMFHICRGPEPGLHQCIINCWAYSPAQERKPQEMMMWETLESRKWPQLLFNYIRHYLLFDSDAFLICSSHILLVYYKNPLSVQVATIFFTWWNTLYMMKYILHLIRC